MERQTFALITGASRGLGKAFAVELAKKHKNLILIALPNENIQTLAENLAKTYDIKTVYFEVDLTDNNQFQQLCKQLTNYQIDTLINNAGIGGTSKFENIDEKSIENIIMLNVRALALLTYHLLPILKRQKKSYILNIASLAAVSPIPYKTVYPASKAFVHSFTLSLYAELKNTNISVSVAYPGAMPTNKAVKERISRYNKFIKNHLLSPEKTAQICLKKMYKGKPVIVPGLFNKISYFLIKYTPTRLRLNFLARLYGKEALFEAKRKLNYAHSHINR